MDVYTVSVEQFAIQNWKANIIYRIKYCCKSCWYGVVLGFWVQVGLDSGESVPRRGYPLVSRNSTEPNHDSFFKTVEWTSLR